MKKLFLLAMFSLLTLISVQIAAAHASVTDSFPKANESVSNIPSRVWIEFDGNLTTIEGHVVNKLFLYDSKGNRIDDGDFLVGGARLSVGVKSQASGNIRMDYRVVSEDGHPVEGEIIFNSNHIDNSSNTVTTVSASPKPIKTAKNQIETARAQPAKPQNNFIANPQTGKTEPESAWEEHKWHLLEFVSVAFLIFIWSRIRIRREY